MNSELNHKINVMNIHVEFLVDQLKDLNSKIDRLEGKLQPASGDEVIGTALAAQILGYSTANVRKLADTGKIAIHGVRKTNCEYKFKRVDIDMYLQERNKKRYKHNLGGLNHV